MPEWLSAKPRLGGAFLWQLRRSNARRHCGEVRIANH
jgi:hypothetical protein